MADSTNEFDYLRRGEPNPGLTGPDSTLEFDFFRRIEAIPVLIAATAAVVATIAHPPVLTLQAVNRSSVM